MNKIFESTSTAQVPYPIANRKFAEHEGRMYQSTGESPGRLTTFENRFAHLIALIVMVFTAVFTLLLPLLSSEFRDNIKASFQKVFCKREINVHYVPYNERLEWHQKILSRDEGIVAQIREALPINETVDKFTWVMRINFDDGKLLKQFIRSNITLENVESAYDKINSGLSKIIEEEIVPSTPYVTFDCCAINRSSDGTLQGATMELKYTQDGVTVSGLKKDVGDPKLFLSQFGFSSILSEEGELLSGTSFHDLSPRKI